MSSRTPRKPTKKRKLTRSIAVGCATLALGGITAFVASVSSEPRAGTRPAPVSGRPASRTSHAPAVCVPAATAKTLPGAGAHPAVSTATSGVPPLDDADDEPALADSLAAAARRDALPGERFAALDAVGRSATADRDAVSGLARLALSDPDPSLRDRAVVALQQVSVHHPELAPLTRSALLDAAARENGGSRAAALETIPTSGASGPEIQRLLVYLGDREPEVRRAVAWSLRDAPADERARVAAGLTRAFESETEAGAARALAATAVRLAPERATTLARLAAAPIARRDPGVAADLERLRAAPD